jgi:hypothetical protein
LQKKPQEQLDFNRLQAVPDAELIDSLNQMKERIRKQSRDSIYSCLKQNSCLGDFAEAETQQKVRTVTAELEELVHKRHPQID